MKAEIVKVCASALAVGSISVAGVTAAERDGATAEAPGIEEVVVTGQLSRFGATKSQIPILETARSISVVDEGAFREFGALTLDDTLAYTAGVIGDSFGFSTRGDFAKVRGFDAAEYRDGQQVLFGYYNNTRSDVWFLEQVEVLKGPASVLYGKGTPGGIVNAISKLAGPGKANEVVLDTGSHSRRQAAVDLNLALSDTLFFRTVALYRKSDTQVDHVNDDAVGFMPSVTFSNDTTTVSAMLEYMDRESDTAHQFLPINATGCLDSSDIAIEPATFCASRNRRELDASAYMGHPDFNRYDSESMLGSILATHQFTETLSVEGVVRYKDASVDYRQAWVNFNGSGVPRIATNGDALRTFYLADSSTRQWAADMRVRWNVDTGFLSHEIIGGIAYQNVSTDSDTTYQWGADSFNVYTRINGPVPDDFLSAEPATNSPANQSEDQGMYVNDQIAIGRWKVNLGLRYDDTKAGSSGSDKQTDYALSGSAGVLYAFANGLSPYISYAESFEPVLGTDVLTGQPLKPREGEQLEAGIKYQPPGTNAFVTLALFDIKETNLPNPLALTGVARSQQQGESRSRGGELEGYLQWGAFSAELNVTLLNSNTPDDRPFNSIPEKQASAWFSYRPQGGAADGFKSGVGVRYVGKNYSDDLAADVRVKTDGYTVFDAMLGYEVSQWDLTLNLRNLTDRDYYSTCLARGDCFPGESRSVVARLAYQF